MLCAYYLHIQNNQQAIRFDIIAVLGSKEHITEILHLEDGFY